MKRILVVDDYKPFLDELSRTAKSTEIAVFTAETSRDAIEQIRGGSFDLVITDLLLERQTAEDGLAVLRAAKQGEFTQVIVVTAYGSPELSVEAMQLGAFDYLERGAPGTNFRVMLAAKIRLALDFQTAKLAIAGR
jgi:two-component system response regulator AtoC